jgi:hypothetical protein
MSKKWNKEEAMEMGVTPCTKAWLKKEMKEPWHKMSVEKMDMKKWIAEEKKELMHRRK